jgi:hypothetical protein
MKERESVRAVRVTRLPISTGYTHACILTCYMNEWEKVCEHEWKKVCEHSLGIFRQHARDERPHAHAAKKKKGCSALITTVVMRRDERCASCQRERLHAADA